MRVVAVLILCLAVSACASFPEVDRAGAAYDDAEAPRLLPTDAVLAMELAPVADEGARAALLARAEGLRARAAAIRRRPVD